MIYEGFLCMSAIIINNYQYMIDKKRVYLQVITWKEDEQALFDYRDYQIQQQFKSCRYSFPQPPLNKSHYYFIYYCRTRNIINNFMFERRMLFDSNPEELMNKTTVNYKMIGGFKLEHRHNERGRSKVYVTAIRRKDIPVKGKQTSQEIDPLPFWVVRTLGEFTIKADQILKFGRIQLRIDSVFTDPDGQEDTKFGDVLNLDQIIEESKLSQDNGENSSLGKKCRICLFEDNHENINNILISPCKCRGSIEFIHVECLKQWLANRMAKISLQSGGSIKMPKKHCCELCKMKLPSRIIKDGKIIPLTNFISQDNTPYVCFAPTNIQHLQDYDRFFLTFSDGSQVRIGRRQEAGMYLADQTVSRKHSIMLIDGPTCIIKDDESKFGTLVYQKNHEQTLGYNYKAFQINSSIFCFTYHNQPK